jgi:5-methylthioadenosine/S-adenosylhomocysteine deaminase
MIKLLKNCTYLNNEFKFKNGDILIEDGIIIDIKDNIEKNNHKIDSVFNCSDYFVLPGFVNGHTHNPSSLFRGIFKDKSLGDWFDNSYQGKLQKKAFDYLDEKVTKEDFHILMLKSYSEYLRQGITTLVETGQSDIPNVYEWTEEVIKTSNLRTVIDVYDNIEKYYNKSNEFIKYCTHLPEEELLEDQSLPELVDIKNNYPSLRMTHCLETLKRKKIINNKFHRTTVELFDKFNLLDKSTLLFHCTYVNNKDIEIIADRQASIVYCPVSNYWSGAGYAPLEKFMQEDINILLGTDFLLSDLWEVMRNTYYYLKTHTDLDRYKAKDIFKMVTTNAYHILFPEIKIGSIDIDYKADLQFINKENTDLMPYIDNNKYSTLLNNILIHGRSSIIENVMIDGKWILKDNKIISFDEKFIEKRYKKILEKIYSEI